MIVRLAGVDVEICELANLPAFETRADASKYRARVAGEHPTPVLREWRCQCGKIHFWSSGLPTDSNGKFKAGNDVVPERIEKLYDARTGDN